MAESSSESDVPISDSSQQFQPREDDAQTLYEVIEITGEKDGKYKVRWKGHNPETMKPWSQSWVPKRDCTDDLVVSWKRKKRQKERRNSKISARDSTTSKRKSRSVVSIAKSKSRSESIATSSNITTKHRSGRTTSAGPSNVKSKAKRRFEEDIAEEEDEPQSGEERNSISVQKQRPSNLTWPTDDYPQDVQPKGTKRKLAQAQSATSSTNKISGQRLESVTVQAGSDEERVILSKPPRKKRKITSNNQRSPAKTILTLQGDRKSHDARSGRGRMQTLATADDEEEESDVADGLVAKKHPADEGEERMTQDTLPEGYHNTHMDDPNDESRHDDLQLDPTGDNMDGRKQMTDKGKGELLRPLREEEEDSDEVEVIESPKQPRLPAQSNMKPLRRPSARMMAQPPPNRKPPSNTHGSQSIASSGPSISGSRTVGTTRPAAETKTPMDSAFVAPSSNQNSRPLKPFSENASRTKAATESPRSNKGPDIVHVQDSDDPDSRLNLSPRALQRLAVFDIEVMENQTRVVEDTPANEANGHGQEAPTAKRSSTSGSSRLATSTVRAALHFGPPSYLVDVVPETELENSQEVSPPHIAVKSHQKRTTVIDASPIDSFTTGPSVNKSLRPLPHISPSTFHPHLQPPNPSLPESIIEPSLSHERNAKIDSIEQFDSPEKEYSNVPIKKVIVLNKNGVVVPEASKEQPIMNEIQSAEEVWDSEVVRRGQVIAEQVEAMRKLVSTSNEAATSPKKKSIQEVVARARSRSSSENNANPLDENDDEEQEEGVVDASTAVVPPASGPPALSQDQLPEVDDMLEPRDDDLANLRMSVGIGAEEVDQTYDIDEASAAIDPELLRQEEEESTQDLMAELVDNTSDGPSVVSSPRGPSPRLATVGDILVSAELTTPSPSPKGPITRSRSKTPSVRTNARGKRKALNIPSPVPSSRESPELGLVKSPVDVFQNVQGPSTTSSILAAQISSLQAQVHEKQSKIDSLQQDLLSLREQLGSSENRNAVLESERERQIAEIQSHWANQTSAWEGERALLVAQNATSEKSKIQAEQDREFIREQYANASAYVTTVREENNELEKRATIAEGQAKQGVELIKATFESQVAKLQDEAKAWRRIAEFAMEKDMRTNDDVRRRAAEEPELRALCVRQKKNLKEMRGKIELLQAELREKPNEGDTSSQELEHWKRENVRLQLDLNEALIKLDRIGRSGHDISQGDGHEFVYRCMWRVETESQSACPEVFATIRELEAHIYSGHLSQQ